MTLRYLATSTIVLARQRLAASSSDNHQQLTQAPELFEGRNVTEKVDVYSFGVLLQECVAGEVPWKTLTTPMQVKYTRDG